MSVEFSNRNFLSLGIVVSGKLGLLILGFIFCLRAGCAINPVTGEEQLMLISEQQDIAIGRKFAPRKVELGRIDYSYLFFVLPLSVTTRRRICLALD